MLRVHVAIHEAFLQKRDICPLASLSPHPPGAWESWVQSQLSELRCLRQGLSGCEKTWRGVGGGGQVRYRDRDDGIVGVHVCSNAPKYTRVMCVCFICR